MQLRIVLGEAWAFSGMHERQVHFFSCIVVFMLSAPFIPLPVNNLIHNKGLFRAAPSQIDTGGFDAGVAQKVGQESDVSAIFNEIFSETMPE